MVCLHNLHARTADVQPASASSNPHILCTRRGLCGSCHMTPRTSSLVIAAHRDDEDGHPLSSPCCAQVVHRPTVIIGFSTLSMGLHVPTVAFNRDSHYCGSS